MGGPTRKVHRNNILNCNLLLPGHSDEKQTAKVRQIHKKAGSSHTQTKDAHLSNRQLRQPRSKPQTTVKQQVLNRQVKFADSLDDSSSSDEEFVVVAPSERGEEDRCVVTDADELIEEGEDELEVTVPCAEEGVDFVQIDTEPESNDVSQASESNELQDESSNEPESSEDTESSSESDTSSNLRRTTRERKPPPILTYSELGVPVIQR